MPDPSSTPEGTAPRGTAVPARVGRYEVTALLGEGAFGRVYRGFDPKLSREVAIKVPHPAALTPDLRERFLREARAAAAIHHPNVCPIYDVETDGDLPYLVMRFVPGGTLAGVLKKRPGPFPAVEAAALVRKLALGVAAAHAQNVLHRDLKPANVLWDAAAGEVLVTDFGLARLAGAEQLSHTGQILGTPTYMSPEQARGRPAEVGAPTDVYSLGVILYRLATGALPFEGSVLEVLAQAQFAAPRPPSEVRPGLDPRVDALCAKAMAKRVADRYPSAKAFADALAAFVRAPTAAEVDLGSAASTHNRAATETVAPGPAGHPSPRRSGDSRAERRSRADTARPLPPAPRSRAARRKAGAASAGYLLAFGALATVVVVAAVVAVLVKGGRGTPTADGNPPPDRDTAKVTGGRPTTGAIPTKLGGGTGKAGGAEAPTGKDPPKAGGPVGPVPPAGPKAGDVRTLRVGNPAVEMPFCWIPPGSFRTGSDRPKGFGGERPDHRVTISRGFWMGRTEVTQAQWKAVVGTDPSVFKGPTRPVENVTWDDAQNYCRKLADALPTRLPVRLPTEAEWEHAARAGTATEYHFGDRISADVANYDATHTWNESPPGPFRQRTTDAGSFPANPWGLHDVHGNVWEWCQDVYGTYPAGDQPDPVRQAGAAERVLRGGCWYDRPAGCRAASRFPFLPNLRGNGVGFRVCFHPD